MEKYLKVDLLLNIQKNIMCINNIHNMTYKDLDKRRSWYRQYYHAHKQKKTVRQMLLEENEKLAKENSELRKQIVLMTCPVCESNKD